ncbi:MAG: hypothetical protein ACRDHM_11680 [Actinomycetota bacterium]
MRTELPEVAGPLAALLEPMAASDVTLAPVYEITRDDLETGPYVVKLDGALVQRSQVARAAVDYVLWHVNTEAIKGTAIHLALHAGAVSRDGKAVILPAPPDSGKTTLTAGLVRAGFEYLSDEAAMIDPGSAWVHPFPRAMWMEQPTVELLGRAGAGVPALENERYHYQVLAEDLRSGSRGRPCPVRFVIAPRYDPAGGTSLEPIGRAEAVRMLAENSFNFSRFGADGLEILGRLVAGAECYRLRVDELASAVDTVSRLFGADAGGGAPSSARRTPPTVAAR